MRQLKKIFVVAIILFAIILGINPTTTFAKSDNNKGTYSNNKIVENKEYSSKADVALYIHTFKKLPKNYITKNQARELGWQGGGLDEYKYGGCIGGSRYGNYEGKLPDKKGRKYYECDIDTLHKSKRGAKRLIYSNDGLIYYTQDHYETFELLYGKE